MFVADHNSAVRRNFKSRAMPEKGKRYIIGTCKKEKNIENIVLEKLRFSGALFFF